MAAQLESWEQVPTVSAADLDRLLTEVAARELARWKEPSLVVRTYGVLQDLDGKVENSAQKGWPKVYGVVLRCEDGGITVDGARKLFEGYADGDYVELCGFPAANVFKGRLSFRLELISVRRLDSARSVEYQVREIVDFARLRALGARRTPFPLQDRVSVTVIHSSATTARVDEDFLLGLAERRDRCDITQVGVRMSSAEAIANAIRQASSDILVLIRGGGDEADFAAFNDAQVLEALAKYPGYRIVGVGHSANFNLVDLVCDYSAPVPAAAGTHLRDQLDQVDGLLGQAEERAAYLKERNAQLSAKLKEAQSVVNRERELRIRAETEASLLAQRKVETDVAKPPSFKEWLSGPLPWLVVVLVVLWWIFAKG